MEYDSFFKWPSTSMYKAPSRGSGRKVKRFWIEEGALRIGSTRTISKFKITTNYSSTKAHFF